MSNLLEKASIVTTPTAYDNGKILSVKPSIVLGEELVTNGDFSNGTNDWSVANGTISVDNDRLKIDGNSGATAEQTVTAIIGKTYKVTYAFTLGTATSGALIITGGNYPTLNAPQGVNTFYTTATQTNLRIRPRLGSNGTMFIDNISVKEAIDADFDFTRNSSATRVNSQGLIEDVQILSSNLVSNGDFSQEGAELITNGDFATDSDWTKDAGWTISNGTASCNGSGVNSLQQSGITTVGKIYKLTFDVLDSNNFNFLVISANFGDTYVDADLNNAVVLGKNTFYIKPTNGTGIRFRVSNGTTLSIDNVSVKEVGQDWEFNSTAILTANGMNITTGGYIRQDVVTIGKSYKLTYDIFSYTSGDIRLYDGTNQGSLPTSIGSNTFNFIAGGSNLVIQSNSVNVNLVITNISVIEITDDTNLPRINYEGFSYQDALGDELVTNGSFSDGLNNWTDASNWWSVVNGEAYHPASTSMKQLYQDVLTEVNKKYKISVNVNIISGTPQVFWDKVSGQEGQSLSQGLNEIIVTTFKTNSSIYFGRVNPTNAEFYIDNVSVKELTEDVLVPDSGRGSWLFEPQSTNLIPYSEDFTEWTLGSGTSIESGYLAPDGSTNAYKVTGSLGALTLSGITNQTQTRTIWAKTVSGTGQAHLCSYFDNTNNIFTITSQWQRFEVNGTTTPTGNTTFYAIDFRGSTDLTEVILWGAQTEALSYPTSYIPTNGSTVTRLQDAAFGSGSSDLINSTEGVLYAEIAALNNTGGRWIALSNGTANERLSIAFEGNNIRLYIKNTSGLIWDYTYTSANIFNYNKIALKYKSGDYALWINGVEVSTDSNSNLTSGLNSLQFDNGGGVANFFGKTKCLAVFKEALTDEELECLTTI